MKKLSEYFGLICFLCCLIIGWLYYKASVKNSEQIEKINLYYDVELRKRDSVNEANRDYYIQDSIWHEADRKLKR